MALGSGGNVLGLIFRIKADGTEQTKEDIRSLRSEFNKNVSDIKSSGTDAFLSIGKSAGFSTDQIANLQTGVLAAVGAVTAITSAVIGATVALFELAKSTAEYGDKLWNAHLKTSVSVETISALERAGQQAGVTLEQISNGLVRFTNNLAAADSGNKKFRAEFEQMGVKTFKDTDKALQEFLTHFVMLRTDQERVLAASDAFGVRMGATFAQLFDQTGGDLDAFKKKLQELGLLVSTEEAKMANDFDDLMKQVTMQLTGFTRQLGFVVIPVFGGFFTYISNSLKENQADWERWSTILEYTLGGVLTAVVATAKFINQSISSIKGALLGLATITNPGLAALRFFGPGGFMDQSSQELLLSEEAFKNQPPAPPSNTIDYKRPSQARKAKKDTQPKKDFEAELSALRDQIAERESAYSEETARLKSEYDQRLFAFNEYLDAERKAADERLKDVTAKLDEENQKVTEAKAAGLIKEDEYLRKTADIQKQKTAANNKRLQEEAKLQAEEYKHEEELLARHNAAVEALNAQRDSNAISDLGTMRGIQLEDADWQIANADELAKRKLEIELKYNADVQAIDLEALDRKEQQLNEEVRLIAVRYAEIKKVTIEEAFASQVVIDAGKERADKIIALETERARIIKQTSDANIAAYRAEARAAFDAANAAAQGATRPRTVGPGAQNPFKALMDSISSGQFTQGLKVMENGTRQFASAATVAFSAVGTVVDGLAQGVGNLVQQWVTLGTLGPHAVQKMVASVLAGLASQAAVQGLMFLAYGIAALTPWGAAVYGPAAPWFKAAALMGAVALAAGVAGRVVAGNSFQESSGGSSGSNAGNNAGASSSQQGLPPISIGRSVGPPMATPGNYQHTIEFRVKGDVVVKEFVRDYQLNGKTRIMLMNDGVTV